MIKLIIIAIAATTTIVGADQTLGSQYTPTNEAPISTLDILKEQTPAKEPEPTKKQTNDTSPAEAPKNVSTDDNTAAGPAQEPAAPAQEAKPGEVEYRIPNPKPSEPHPHTITDLYEVYKEPTEKNPNPLKSCKYTLYNGNTPSVRQGQNDPCYKIGEILPWTFAE